MIEGAHAGAVAVDPPEADIDYPEGELLPEAPEHARRRREIVTALEHWLADAPDAHGAWVCDNVNIYYRRREPRAVGTPEVAVVAPDVAVAFGVNTDRLAGARTYRVWEAGAAPSFVLEIASPSTRDTDETDKPATYAELGADEYWRLDPTGGELFTPPLRGERRTAGRWQPITIHTDTHGAPWGHSTTLELDLCWTDHKLRLRNPATGTWLLDHDDRRHAHHAAQTHAARETARANREAARADQQTARAEREATARRAAQTRAEREAARADEEAARAERAEAELAALRGRLGPEPPAGDGRR